MNNLTINKKKSLRPSWTKEIERFFDEGFFWNIDNPITSLLGPTRLPAVNVTNGEKEAVVEMALPGVQKGSIEISIDGDVMTVSSHNKEEKEEKNGENVRKEFSYSSFSRSFALPEDADSDKIESSLENGILKIVIPKTGKTKPKRVVEVK